jgi:hypothetical protein
MITEKTYTPDIIQSLWIGSELSPVEQMCIKSFLRMGHPFHLYVYGQVKGIPEGTIVKQASQIVPIWKVEKFPSLAQFADYFRCCLLYKNGSWWVDLDVFCLRPFDFSEPYIVSQQLAKDSGCEEICNGIIKSPIHSELMRDCASEIERLDPMKATWVELGAVLLENNMRRLGLTEWVKPHWVFIPLPWWDAPANVFGPDSAMNCFGDAYSVHLWNEQTRRCHVDKFGPWLKGSLAEALRRSVE